MEFVVRGPLGEWRSSFPATLWATGDSFRLEGRDRIGLDLSRLADGETLTGHVAVGDAVEDDAAFALTMRDGKMVLRKADGEREIDPVRWRGAPFHAFAPWRAVVREGERVVESWPEISEAFARNTAEMRLAEYARERRRGIVASVEPTPRIPAADLEPAARPGLG